MSKADIVNDWFRQSLAGGPLAQHTPGYNQVIAALPALIARLDAADPGAGPRPSKATKAAVPPAPPANADPDATDGPAGDADGGALTS